MNAVEEIKAIANWAVEKTCVAVPYSSNLPYRQWQFLHRELFLHLMRRSANSSSSTFYQKRIATNANVKKPLTDSLIKLVQIKNAIHTMDLINDIVQKKNMLGIILGEQEKSLRVNFLHKPMNFNGQIVSAHVEKLIKTLQIKPAQPSYENKNAKP